MPLCFKCEKPFVVFNKRTYWCCAKCREDTIEYRIWSGIKTRCFNKRHHSYKGYGGRGIGMDDRWVESFMDFVSHMGRCPSKGHSIDRIDSNKGYVPGNVRWATSREQNINQKRIIRPTINGIQYDCVKSACKAIGLTEQGLRYRVKKGFTVQEALLQKRRKN